MAVQALIPLATTLLSGAIGMSQQSNILEQQKAENLNAFNRNKELALLQNKLNIEQWNRENAYNHPTEQMKRLQQAGLNPDMIYSGGASNNISATSPSMTAGTPYNPVDYSLGGQRKTIGDIVNQSYQNSLLASQAKKAHEEAEGQKEKNKSIFALDQAELRSHFINQGYTEQQTKNLIAEFDNIAKIGAKIESDIEVNSATIRDMDNQIFTRTIQTIMQSREIEQKIKNLQKEYELTDAQIQELKDLLPLKIRQLVLANENAELQGNQIAGQILLDTAELITEGYKASSEKETALLLRTERALRRQQIATEVERTGITGTEREYLELERPERRRQAYTKSLWIYKITAGIGDIIQSALPAISAGSTLK